MPFLDVAVKPQTTVLCLILCKFISCMYNNIFHLTREERTWAAVILFPVLNLCLFLDSNVWLHNFHIKKNLTAITESTSQSLARTDVLVADWPRLIDHTWSHWLKDHQNDTNDDHGMLFQRNNRKKTKKNEEGHRGKWWDSEEYGNLRILTQTKGDGAYRIFCLCFAAQDHKKWVPNFPPSTLYPLWLKRVSDALNQPNVFNNLFP